MPQLERGRKDDLHRQHHTSSTSTARDAGHKSSRRSPVPRRSPVSRRSPAAKRSVSGRQRSVERKAQQKSGSSSLKENRTKSEAATAKVERSQPKSEVDQKRHVARDAEPSARRQNATTKREVPSSPVGERRRPRRRRSPSTTADEGTTRKRMRHDDEHGTKVDDKLATKTLKDAKLDEGKRRNVDEDSHRTSRRRAAAGIDGVLSSSVKKEEGNRSRPKSSSPSAANVAKLTSSSTADANAKDGVTLVTDNSAVAKEDEAFGNDGFARAGGRPAASSNLFGNSGFANHGFSSTTMPSSRGPRRSTNVQDASSTKPRILPPNVSSPSKEFAAGVNFGGRQNGQPKQQQQQNTFNIIVNELSEVSIKREEHPMRGFGKMASRPNRGQSFVRRGGGVGRGGIFGATNQQQRGMGQRDGMNPARTMMTHKHTAANDSFSSNAGFGSTNANFSSGAPYQRQQRHVQQQQPNSHRRRHRSLSMDKKEPVPAAPGKAVQSSVVVVGAGGAANASLPLNPLAVPRGRNYFLHDARDDLAAAAHHTTRQLYDPRLDRGNSSRRGGRPLGLAGGGDRAGAFRGRHEPEHTTHHSSGGGRASATTAEVAQPPMGWRNNQFGDDTEQQQHVQSNFSRRASGTFLGRGNFGSRGGRIYEWQSGGRTADASSLDGRPQWQRSKADADRVWSHDKFFEEEQAENKLELVDELNTAAATAVAAAVVGGGSNNGRGTAVAVACSSSQFEDPWTGKQLPQMVVTLPSSSTAFNSSAAAAATGGVGVGSDHRAVPKPVPVFDDDEAEEELVYD
uniref:Btz domain-containing protein n=1 Tax=Globodera pallida TaxID=36090 RepID=A0A183C834_GLOPA